MIASMLNPIRQVVDKSNLLAIVTALVLLVLALIGDNRLVLLMSLAYGVLGVYGLYREQQLSTAQIDVQVEQSGGTEAAVIVAPDSLKALATRMGVTVDGLVRATSAINDVTSQQSSSAEEQVTVISSTNKLLDDFLILSERINEQTRAVTHTAQEAADISENGQEALEQSIHSMSDIRRQVEAIGGTIVRLAALTRKIDEIITSVGEIATQSNLLALNASIEAARAGVHGRGFAVVADEVRSLAQQSTQSAEQIRNILGEIQNATREAVRATQQGIENVDVGSARTHEASEVILKLTESVKASREAVNEIYTIIRQQSEGMEEIAIGMDRIQRITQHSLASTRTVETVSTNLTRLANDLQMTVTKGTQSS